MNKLIPFFFLYMSIIISGCDPCKDTTCLSGGECQEGNCICPDGYSGAQCETYDQCYNIICLNGGNCVNGACNCPEGFSGSDCSVIVAPSKMIIDKIYVYDFPETDNGAGWDLSSAPDVYFVLYKGTQLVIESQTYYQDALPNNGPFTFDLSPDFEIDAPQSQYSIVLYDYDDLDSDDYMGGITFTPYTGDKPNTLTIMLGDFHFKMDVSYIY